MKKTLVILLAVAMMLVAVPAFAAPLTDAPATDHWVYEYYELVYDAGIIKGYPDGTFKGEKAATRYEVVAFMARLLQYLDARLADIKPGEPATTTDPVSTLDEERVKALIEEALAELNYVDAATLKEETDLIWTAITELEKALRDDLNALGVRVTTLEKRVDALEKQVASLEKGLADVNSEIDSLKETASAAEKGNSTATYVAIGAAILGVAGIVLALLGP